VCADEKCVRFPLWWPGCDGFRSTQSHHKSEAAHLIKEKKERKEKNNEEMA